ncbi:tRNA (adenosine(37)-N6)-threonylcarbamoyltransferase complex dimerization subunit type 1 TsaB [Magnetospirillum sulfuroxidans]|uniref:tRNA (Adenosine(37)-N6)-threonylcarbamoyltransferase complex dimerization subunit type 1 TsaB n=1 Tax=Magnetospirillum sulfuroxidans TaxID=611300 RepID=A0ABS5IGZ2_9PROT|nr:tRNA (adenosine(37)-N6)-threonylcarbamoyltransferase complex dimerization subunit type 1 TsaB [Magnetospirillum sulfuroxidans]MBR9972963.1 tRNA (adenosine(37)-N6)-threonylcarbamoyltransferase complex dimerization subunit type 1 TsaB [Magnetospirillum sulfuroxidans]
MLILALDSAGSACSSALWRDGVVVARRFAAMARGQSEALIPMVQAVMDEAGCAFGQVDLLAVSVGPGAFTGIRIGLSAARALALAAAKPLAGIATTEAIAAAIPAGERQDHTVMVVVDSRRAELWVQVFSADLVALGPIQALLPEQAALAVSASGPVILAGDGAAQVAHLLPGARLASTDGFVDAVQVAQLAAARWPAGVLAPEPLYLRPADVTLACA